MTTVSRSAISQLAVSLGVEMSYESTEGKVVRASDEDLLPIVTALLGETIGSSSEAENALERRSRELDSRWFEPVLVKRPGLVQGASVILDGDIDPDGVELTVVLEDSSELAFRLSDVGVPTGSSVEDRIRYTFDAVLRDVPIGYHTLLLDAPRGSGEAMIVSAPAHCPRPDRGWGAFMPLYALRPDSEDWGTGSFTDLGRLDRWIESHGGDFVGTLPLLAPFFDPEAGYLGPYVPASKLAWNEAYIDVDSIPELSNNDDLAATARAMLASDALRSDTAGLSRLSHSDLAGVLRLKRPILELLAHSMEASDRRPSLDEFALSRPDLRSFATFKAACDKWGPVWQQWPGASPRSIPKDGVSDQDVLYHLFVQWIADEQLKEQCGQALYLDMPIGVHPSGFDTWWSPESFVTGISGGAPPDAFFSKGQSWGFPPLHPGRIRDERYRYFIATLRHLMARASISRIDHVMGLHRLYWVPTGSDARRGVYVEYNAEELHAIVVLEAWRSGCSVIGEDLGTVPAEVRRKMARDGMLSSFVFEFASTATEPLPEPSDHVLASFATHDLPTFAGYWSGLDITERLSDGQIDQSAADMERKDRDIWRESITSSLGVEADSEAAWPVLRGVLLDLASSPAPKVMVDIEDLWLEKEQQNHPGTGPEAHNFSRRATHTISELDIPRIIEFAEEMSKAIVNPTPKRAGTGGAAQ